MKTKWNLTNGNKYLSRGRISRESFSSKRNFIHKRDDDYEGFECLPFFSKHIFICLNFRIRDSYLVDDSRLFVFCRGTGCFYLKIQQYWHLKRKFISLNFRDHPDISCNLGWGESEWLPVIYGELQFSFWKIITTFFTANADYPRLFPSPVQSK